MLIATWNVNSIRSRLEQVERWLIKNNPDVLCLQETKVENKSFPDITFKSMGYKVYFSGQKSYNGVAIISRIELQDIKIDFESVIKNDIKAEKLSNQKRIISALANGIRIINVYVPNGSSLLSEKFEYKLEWLKYLKSYIKNIFLKKEPICLLGDFNIALEERDIHNPEKLSGDIMASNQERNALQEILNLGLEDIFRIFEPCSDHWTWWDYRHSAWEKNRGWRIDHIYLSEELVRSTLNCFIDKEIRGNLKPSDHAPVVVNIQWPNEEDEYEL